MLLRTAHAQSEKIYLPADGALPIVLAVVIVGREEDLLGGVRACGYGGDVLIVDSRQRGLAGLGTV